MSGALVPGDQTIVGNLTVAGEIIGFSNKVATDGNGDLRVANSKKVVFSTFDGKGIGFSLLRDEKITEGHGQVVAGTEWAETSVIVSQQGGRAVLSTARRGRCDVGRTAEIGIALKTSHMDTVLSQGQEMRWGYFDDTDGFMFIMDASGLGVAIEHSVNGRRTYRRSEWNIDRLDGQGPSGIAFDPSLQVTMYQVLFTWGTSGAIVFRIILTNEEGNQFVQPVHRAEMHADGFHVSNRYVLPVRCSVEWKKTDGSEASNDPLKAMVVGRYFSIIGGSEHEARWGTSTPPRLSTAFSLSKGLGNISATRAEYVHLLSVRRKDAFVDGGRIELTEVDIIFENVVVDMMMLLLQIRVGATKVMQSGTEPLQWRDLSHVMNDETALQESTADATVQEEDGIVVFSTLIVAGRKESQKATLNTGGLGLPEGTSPMMICVKPVSVETYTGAIGSGVTSFIGRASCVAKLQEAW